MERRCTGILKLFLEYYHGTRTHLSVVNTPERRSVQPP
jgi:hypothetical protein